MFTPESRGRLREALVTAALADDRLSGVAVTGSAAADREDRWSDIDLAFGVAADSDLAPVLADWTQRMYDEHRTVHHVDVRRGPTVYRVFLLDDTLQVDLAFSPAADFGAIAPTFKLLAGTAAAQVPATPPSAAELVGLAWLHALHARSSLARHRLWQAEYMVSGVRDHVLALACLRHGVRSQQARGIDDLPPQASAPAAEMLVRSLDETELRRAFRAAVGGLVTEVAHVDSALHGRLTAALQTLTKI